VGLHDAIATGPTVSCLVLCFVADLPPPLKKPELSSRLIEDMKFERMRLQNKAEENGAMETGEEDETAQASETTSTAPTMNTSVGSSHPVLPSSAPVPAQQAAEEDITILPYVATAT
jgi:hypothetical protein